jgi:integrase
VPITIDDIPAGSVSRNTKTGAWVADFDSRRWGRKQFKARTKTQARAKLNEHRQQLVDGLDPSRRTVAQLVDEDLAAYRAAKRAPSSVTHRTWALAKATDVIGKKLVADVTERDVEKVLAAQPGLSPRTLNGVRKAMIGLFDRAIRDGLILRNPARNVARIKTGRKPLKLPPRAEVVALLDELMATPHGPILNAIAAGGLRTGEARGIRLEDVHEDYVSIRGQLGRDGEFVEPKTAAGVRNIPISPRMRIAIDTAMERRGRTKTEYLFVGTDRKPFGAFAAYQAWSKARDRATTEGSWTGEPLTVHGLRHLALSTFVHAPNVSIADAAALAGHADGGRTVVETYVHQLDDDRERIRQALEDGGLG